MTEDIRLGRIAGFDVGMNWSVLVIAWLLTWSLADGTLPMDAPGHTPGTYWVAGAGTALLFFASLLSHELAHAVVARRAGLEVKGVTLWLFGGVASLGREPATPRDDLRIAVVGPLTSLALALGFATAAAALDAVGVAHIVVSALWWLAGINLLLGAFNLVPGAPLDGGRVLRAYLWRRHGDRLRAARSAARAGRSTGFALVGLGLAEVAFGALGRGIWLAFIGWFILSAARAEDEHAVVHASLQGLRVADVMTAAPVTAPGSITISEFVDDYVLGRQHSAYPVVDASGTVNGLVTLQQLRAVEPRLRDRWRVADVVLPVAGIVRAAPTDGLADLVDRLAETPNGRALIFERERLVGIVTPADIARAVEVHRLRDSRAAA